MITKLWQIITFMRLALNRQEFEQWAERELFDISTDPNAPIYTYTCWKTDAAELGWQYYYAGVEYNQNPYMWFDRESKYWDYGWRGARECEYNKARDSK